MTRKKTKQDKALMKAARQLRRAFEKRALGAYESIFELFPALTNHWDSLTRERGTLDKREFASTTEGMREARRLLRRLRGHAHNLKQTCHHLVQRIDTCSDDMTEQLASSKLIGLPTLTDCYKQLEALKKEFGTCKLDERRREIIVTSHEVQLQNVFFGRYYIHIELDRIMTGNRTFYRVDPVSAECPTVEGSTHPHLNQERLCEGAGVGAITKAFDDGRLYDCCLLINSILQTYGSGPYVDIEVFARGDDDSDYVCASCTVGLSEGDRFVCESCDEDLCRGCVTHCEPANHWICTECLESSKTTGTACFSNCPHIGEEGCAVRLNASCPECGDIYPDTMLAECEIIPGEAQLCKGCAETRAGDRVPCDACLMHGYLGCALVKYGYPLLNTLNHPAYVEVSGRRHKHHKFSWHAVGLFHSAQEDDYARPDFRAYRDHLAQRRWPRQDYQRRRRHGQHTMTHHQRADLTLAEE